MSHASDPTLMSPELPPWEDGPATVIGQLRAEDEHGEQGKRNDNHKEKRPARKRPTGQHSAVPELAAVSADPNNVCRPNERGVRSEAVQVLDPLTLPLIGSRLIEASAGTGKTYTIAQLYVRLVLGHGSADSRFIRALTPPEILVVTFTDAATQELKDRIRQRLGEAAAVFEDADSDWAAAQQDLVALREQYPPEDWPGCAKLLRVAADWMDEAAVSTIHSWCYRMLREHAFDSGNLFTQNLITDESELRLEAARDYWRRHFYALNDREAKTLYGILQSPDALAEAIKALLAHARSQWQYGEDLLDPCESPVVLLQQYTEMQAKLEALENEARALWREQWDQIVPVLVNWPGASFARSKFTSEQMQGWINDLRAWSEGEPAPSDKDKGKKGIRFFGQAKLDEYGKGHPPQMAAFAAIDKWLEAASDSDARLDSVRLRAQLLAHATWHVHGAMDAEKRRRAELSFDDVLHRLHEALATEHGAVLAERIRQQFPVAMIDEFQDTDPVQWSMFDRVYGVSDAEQAMARDRALLLIGDPKQAIYAFRGADIHTYLQARRATQGRHHSLGTNYRSTQALVHGVNRLFGWAESHWPQAAFRFAQPDAGSGDDDNPMPFMPVAAQGRRERLLLQGEPAAALNWWWLGRDSGDDSDAGKETAPDAAAGAGTGAGRRGKPKPPEDGVSIGAYRHAMAQACASQIARWLGSVPAGATGFERDGQITPLRPRDMAVLVRSRTEADAIRHALAQRGIASAYLSERESVFDSVEAQDFALWLEAVHSDGQGSRLRAALATLSMGRSHAWLEQLNQDETLWDEQVVRFRHYNQIWREHGVLPMTRALLHDYALPSGWLSQPGGTRTLTNVLHLAEWLQKQATQFDSQRALLRELLRQIAHEGEASDGARLRLESDEDLIKVVTIHKSKGLEYPLVFLPFIAAWTNPPSTKTSLILPADEVGGPRRVNLEVSHSQDKALEELERQREDLRLLYVAVTRARHAMWLGVAPLCSGNRKSCQMEKSALGYLLGGTEVRTALALRESLRELCLAPAGLEKQWQGVMQLDEMPEITQERWQPPEAAAGVITRLAPPRHWRHWWVASYTTLTHGLQDEDRRVDHASPGHTAEAAADSALLTLAEPESVDAELLHEATLEGRQLAAQALDDAAHEGAGVDDMGTQWGWDLADEDLTEGDAEDVVGGNGATPARNLPIAHPAAAPALRPAQGIHAFARGAAAGTFWHGLLEVCGLQGFARMAHEPDKLHELVRRRATVQGWEAQVPVITQWLGDWLHAPLPLKVDVQRRLNRQLDQYSSIAAVDDECHDDTGGLIRLVDLSPAAAKPEMEFLLPVQGSSAVRIDQLVRQHVLPDCERPALNPLQLNGMLKGFMDLVFEVSGGDGSPCFYVLDYKSNWLGPDDSHYHPQALQAAVLHSRYDLQGVLYQLALHRLLRTRLGEHYDPQRHLGGSLTWFLRGVGHPSRGVWQARAPLALLDALDALFDGAAA